MSLKGFYKTDVITVRPEQTVVEAAILMRDRHVGNVVVVEETSGKRVPVGLLTDRDLAIGCVASANDRISEMKVEELMATDPVCVKEDQGIYEVAQCMRRQGVARVPVVAADGSLLGIITSKNILALLSDELNEIVEISDSRREAGRRAQPSPSRLDQSVQTHMQ